MFVEYLLRIYMKMFDENRKDLRDKLIINQNKMFTNNLS